ncbi:MAG: hypothetical protein MUP04_01180 [Anaerolineae bacterium]|jgi:hypothetical protein|nr:hypothetical protein [Anaerolineae bacterium]
MVALLFWRILAFITQRVVGVRPLLLFLVCSYLLGCLLGFLFAAGGM